MTKGISKTYPSNEALVLCDGGLNSKFDRAIIADNESPSCLNVVFTNGGVETRPGSSGLNTTSVGSFPCDGLYVRHANTGSETMVAFFNGSGYDLGGTTFTTIPSAQSVFTAGVRVSAAEYENKLFVGNGGVEPYKFDGVNWTRHGVPAPISAPLAGTAVTAGSLTGSFTFKIAYMNSHVVVGDLGPAVTFVLGGAGAINLTSIPVAPQSFGVDARRIYVATAATYNLHATIANNTATTFTVETNAATTLAPSDNGVPPKYSQVIYHRDRLFMNDPANPNYYWYSALGEPYTVPSTNFGTVGDNTRDLIRGFAVQGESLLIICDKAVWMLYMPSTDDTAWQLVKVRTPYGSKSPFAFTGFEGKTMYPAMDNDKFVGFASISGAAVAPDATFLTVSTAGSDLQSNAIEPDMFLVPENQVGNISGVSYKNRLFFSMPVGVGSTTNNRVYCYDFGISNLSKKKQGAWVPFTGWNASQFCLYAGNLYYGSSAATGLVYKCMVDGVYADAGAAIDSYFWTKEFSGFNGDQDAHKDFRFLHLYYEKSGAWYLNIGYRNDGDMGSGTSTQIDANPGSSLWNSFVWGMTTWGGGQKDAFDTISLGESRGRRIQFKFSNQNVANQKFKVTGYRFSYNLKGRR